MEQKGDGEGVVGFTQEFKSNELNKNWTKNLVWRSKLENSIPTRIKMGELSGIGHKHNIQHTTHTQ